VHVEPAVVERAVASLAEAARRHGGSEVAVRVEGERVTIEPVGDALAQILVGDDLKDLGSAVGVRVVRALGGSAEHADGRFVLTLPSA
jgi:hypothetical protein